MRATSKAAALMGLLVLAAPRLGLADGCMMAPVGTADKLVESPKQEAVLVADGETVRVVLRTHFNEGPQELAWVVPVPPETRDVREADDAIFARLDEIAAPRFFRYEPKGGFGCGCGTMGMGEAQMARSVVVVESSGTAGVFEYAVLSSTDAGELTRWLTDRRYHIPEGAEPVFRRYVKGGWHFLAMRVRPEAADEPTLAPHPVTYTYRGSEVVYPMVISRLSSDERCEVVLYVVGYQRYACRNWRNATIDRDQVRLKPGTASGTNYERIFLSAVEENAGRAFVAEFAQRLSADTSALLAVAGDEWDAPRYLTRLRTVLTSGTMDRDVELVPIADAESVDNVYHIAAGGAGSAILPMAILLAAAAMAARGVWLLTRPYGGAAGALYLGMACITLMMV